MNTQSPQTTHRFNGKIALVIGGSRGIGRAIAQRLARDGAHVVINFKSDAVAAQETVDSIQNAGGKAHAIQADVSDLADIETLFADFESQFDGLDFLINNAGIASFASLQEAAPEDLDAMFSLNVRGVFFTTQRALKSLRDGGRIINISSGITRVNASGGSVYAASKSAVEAFTRSWASELGPRQITVNTVSPGMTATEMMAQVIAPEALENMRSQTPLGRIGQPNDIADAVALLCSEEARWLTAQNVLANGGVG